MFRLDGTRVPEYDEDRQGSIVNVFDPFRDDLGEIPDSPNNRIKIELSWEPLPTGAVATLEEDGPSFGKGTINIYQYVPATGNYKLVKHDYESSVELDLDQLSNPQEFWVEGIKTGVTNLKFVIRVAGEICCEDTVRITGISDVPKDGRIVFVNPLADGHNAPYDCWETQAARFVADAIDNMAPDDNIVIAPLVFDEYDLEPRYNCCIAGLYGNHDGAVEVTQFNLAYATVINPGGTSRAFSIGSTTSESDEVLITGMNLVNGRADQGGAVLSDEDSDANLTISFCHFERNYSTGPSPDILDFAGYPQGLGGGPLLSGAGALFGAVGFLAPGGPQPAAKIKGGGAVTFVQRYEATGVPAKTVTLKRNGWKDNSSPGLWGGAVLLMRAADEKTPATALAQLPADLNALTQLPADLKPKKCRFRTILPRMAALFDRCKFISNTASKGGAIAATLTSNANRPKTRMTGGMPFLAERCLFRLNKAKGGKRNRGGAIFLWGINCTGTAVRGCTFEENKALGPGDGNGDGGAIAALFMAAMTVDTFDDGTRCVFFSNTAADGGGAIYVTLFAVMRICEAKIKNNTSSTGAGACHVTSGAVVDIVRSNVEDNFGAIGGAMYNRNARLDVRESVVQNNGAVGRGGGIYVLCSDDSSGNSYPDSAVNPAILHVKSSKILGNTARDNAGAIEMHRAGNADPSYINVADKLLKLDIFMSDVSKNVATVPDDSLGLVGGVAMTKTDESALNRPNFNRVRYTTNLHKAFSLTYVKIQRWPDGPNFTRKAVAKYIVDIMLWGGFTDNHLANDFVQGSTFKDNTNVQASAAGGVRPKHLIKGANTVVGNQRPWNLFW